MQAKPTESTSRSHVYFLCTISSPKSVSNISSSFGDQPSSFTVSYLMESCGMSLESAISTANKLRIQNKEKEDSVIELLGTHGFTQADIAHIIAKNPRLLLSDRGSRT
uniref:Uncharacterized protein n=1 Tax=Nelumbo nucifera TaxID=4432 RepID=A0A822YN42_NELNU|nr:TPA_asm: hypothetical protein HUJ06_004660 [Nelumbo nucifera]